MKNYIKILFTFLLLIPISIKADVVEINSQNAVLINLNNNEILYEKNKDEVIKVASVQKIMTSLVAIENVQDLNEEFTLEYGIFNGLDPELAVAGFSPGDIVTYNDLLYATLLKSGGDAAYALGIKVAGSEEAYVNLMNEKAKELGLKNTHFTNTTGLDDYDQYSTVNDMAIILKYAINNREFRNIISTPEYTTSNGEISFRGPVKKAKELGLFYFEGGKTGFTDLAGLCLASFASYNNVDYLLVTARASQDLCNQNFIDQKNIYEYFMKNYSFQPLSRKGKTIKTIKTMYDDEVKLKSNRDVEMYINDEVYKNELEYIYEGKEVLERGVKKGDIIGKYTIKAKDKVLYEEDILSPVTVTFKLKKTFVVALLIIVGSMIIHLFFRSIRRKRRRKRRRN